MKDSNCCQTAANHKKSAGRLPLGRYRPLWLFFLFVGGIAFFAQYPLETFAMHTWMRHAMAGIWLGLAFFKLLNPSQFAATYAKYDLVARGWPMWRYLYPFIELALGMAYLIALMPITTYAFSVALIALNSAGIVQSLYRKEKRDCACLGGAFTWPIGGITLIENALMMTMSIYLLYLAL